LRKSQDSLTCLIQKLLIVLLPANAIVSGELQTGSETLFRKYIAVLLSGFDFSYETTKIFGT
jgi:hypothetical protein